jgi:Ca2+-dependent lipid-binding protein
MNDFESNTLLRDTTGMQPVMKEPKTLRVLQIFVQGKKLKNLDGVRDMSDTQVALKMKWLKDQKDWVQVDQTEVVVDNLNPSYEHHFEVVYNFGSLVTLKFECNNINANGKHQLIGECEITIPELVRKASARGLNVPLTGKTKDVGILEFIVQEPTQARSKYYLELQPLGLPSQKSYRRLNFTTTYFMEIFKGEVGS